MALKHRPIIYFPLKWIAKMYNKSHWSMVGHFCHQHDLSRPIKFLSFNLKSKNNKYPVWHVITLKINWIKDFGTKLLNNLLLKPIILDAVYNNWLKINKYHQCNDNNNQLYLRDRNVHSKSSKDEYTSTQPLHLQDKAAFFLMLKDTQLVSPLGKIFLHFRIVFYFLHQSSKFWRERWKR